MKIIEWTVESFGAGTEHEAAVMEDKLDAMFDEMDEEVETNEELGFPSRVTIRITIERVGAKAAGSEGAGQ